MKDYDVIVVGGGGAGLNISQLLASQDLNVLLLEAKSDLLSLQFHTLGSFIDLENHGLSQNVIASNLTENIIHSKRIHVKKYGKAYILDKLELHKELLQKCKDHNVEIQTSARVVKSTVDNNGCIKTVIDLKGNEYGAKIFVDASGNSGVLSKEFGLMSKENHYAVGLEYNVEYLGLQNQSHLFIGKLYEGGYGWIFPLKNKRAILGYGSFDSLARTDVQLRLNKMFEIDVIKKLVVKDNNTAYGGMIPISEIKSSFVKGNLVCVGDSVSQVNPIVGEGYRFVLEAGLIASKYIVEAVKTNNNSILLGYQDEWNNKFYKEYKFSKRLQNLANRASKSDLLTDFGNLLLKTKRNKTFVKLVSGAGSILDLILP